MLLHLAIFYTRRAGIAQLARASPCQGEGRGFESRFPLHRIILYSCKVTTDKFTTVEFVISGMVSKGVSIPALFKCFPKLPIAAFLASSRVWL